MLTVGLTGGIACGKSLVRRELQRLGAATVDADDLARKAVQPGSPALKRIARAFGFRVFDRRGQLDRAKLAAIVFSDRQARERLNAIVHPEVFRFQKQWLEDLGRRPPEERPVLAVVDAALMIETGSYRRYDALVVVFCPQEQQVKRLMQRDQLTRQEALRRVRSQMPVQHKRDFADFVIDSSGDRESALRQTREVYQKLMEQASRSKS